MKSSVLLVRHAARCNETHPPNSIGGLQACLDAGARVVEVDISPLADGDFLLLHDRELEHGTNGSGPVDAYTADQVSDLRLTWQGSVTDESVGLLSQALDLLSRHPHPVELQLDLKAHTPLDDRVLSPLVAALQPMKNRVRVTSLADWALRRLRAMDADLPLGFDPLLYLDVSPRLAEAPFRQGAYGYWDDHPLASVVWRETPEYLAARAEALRAQSPPGAIWYIRARLLASALEEGFDWIATLHAQGAQVTAWTLDADQPDDLDLARQLVTAGVDRITTNDAPALARAFAKHAQGNVSVEY